jgi:steroid delta-isomerase-like uncharacterized protein
MLAGLLTAASLGSAALGAEDCPPSNTAEAETIGRAYFNAFNSGDGAALDKLLAADYHHQGAVIATQDRAKHLERLREVRQAFPDGVYTIDWLIADKDTVAIRHRFKGTHRGTYTGVPASGRSVAVGAFHVHRIACGRIAETWNAGDGVGLLRQIGAIPGPATTAADEEPRSPVSPGSASCPATSLTENAAAARRWYDEVLNQGRFEVLDDLLAEDVVHHAALFVDLNGRHETAESLRAIRAGFPDIHYNVDGVIAVGDKVLIRWAGKGTQRGTFLGFPPSNASVNWSGMNAFRFACGKIVEGWSEANGLTVLRQIGALR